jgi:acetyl-CoA carboxylase biotin carboxylase subunit
MGILSVAVYSQADNESIHISMADECICIGNHLASNSYLNQEAIITAALLTGCQAIHPGYGFLAENAQFAALCKKNDLVFIGPDSEIISKMGDKDVARKIMSEAKVPTVPGSGIVSNVAEAKKEANRIGYPILIKAKAGGGGRGIRFAGNDDELESGFLVASSEAQSAFGDGGVYLEKFLSPVKHIEVQILADEKGNVVCLGERECSIQFKNQKLIEESPSSVISQSLRETMMSSAAKAAKAVGYTNAGTIEFLLDIDNNYYFMEMNTRLQVEHPITEMVTGIDIVKWQIRIAAGVELNFKQKDVKIEGNSIECRINADMSTSNSNGEITFLHVPGGPQVRFDTFLYQGYKIPPFYDSLMGKLIIHAKTREEAIRKMKASLCELVIEGIPNNIAQQLEIISSDEFTAGDYYTNFMEKRG